MYYYDMFWIFLVFNMIHLIFSFVLCDSFNASSKILILIRDMIVWVLIRIISIMKSFVILTGTDYDSLDVLLIFSHICHELCDLWFIYIVLSMIYCWYFMFTLFIYIMIYMIYWWYFIWTFFFYIMTYMIYLWYLILTFIMYEVIYLIYQWLFYFYFIYSQRDLHDLLVVFHIGFIYA